MGRVPSRKCHACGAPIAIVGRDCRGKCNRCVSLSVWRRLERRRMRYGKQHRVPKPPPVTYSAKSTTKISTTDGKAVENARARLLGKPLPVPATSWEDTYYRGADPNAPILTVADINQNCRTVDEHGGSANELHSHDWQEIRWAIREATGRDVVLDHLYLKPGPVSDPDQHPYYSELDFGDRESSTMDGQRGVYYDIAARIRNRDRASRSSSPERYALKPRANDYGGTGLDLMGSAAFSAVDRSGNYFVPEGDPVPLDRQSTYVNLTRRYRK